MLSLDFENVFSRALGMISDPTLLQLSADSLKEIQTEWLFRSLSDPRVTHLFSTFEMYENEARFQFELKNSTNDFADKNYIIELLSIGMTIAWLQPQIDSILNVAPMIGGKEEKKLLDNHKNSIERLEKLKVEQHKLIRNRGYLNNSYLQSV